MADIKELLEGCTTVSLRGEQMPPLLGITDNSKEVRKDFLFVAKGRGSFFIEEALQKGAVALLVERYLPQFSHISQIITPSIRETEAVMASRLYEHPSKDLFVVGVTGTNGKTTTTYLVKHLLAPCGMIGTVEWCLGDRNISSTNTTPGVTTCQALLKEMAKAGLSSVAMEVSSHGLDQGRVDLIEFDVGIFTNLTLDHLDYHKTWENYAQAKKKLFSMLSKESVAVYNGEDPHATSVVGETLASKISFGFSSKEDLWMENLQLTPDGMTFCLQYGKSSIAMKSPLIGRFNGKNLMGAMGAALAYGKSMEEIRDLLEGVSQVPGRLERIPNERGIHLFVDYAHTDDALKNILETLRELRSKKIILVFGCGGDRDRTKRPKMAKVAEELADEIWITSDNPRSEDPRAIVQEMLVGVVGGRCFVEIDRKEAIRKAIESAEPGDIVVIAGKGHEVGQIVSGEVLPFDDRLVAKEFSAF